MSGSGSSSGTTSAPINVDQDALSGFMNSQAGTPFKSQYVPGSSYYNEGNANVGLGPNGQNQGDVSGMLSAFAAWQADQGNANQTWSNYAKLVGQQGGGEGTSTILGSAALTPYQSILAAQQGTGVIGNPTNTTTLQAQQKKVGAP